MRWIIALRKRLLINEAKNDIEDREIWQQATDIGSELLVVSPKDGPAMVTHANLANSEVADLTPNKGVRKNSFLSTIGAYLERTNMKWSNIIVVFFFLTTAFVCLKPGKSGGSGLKVIAKGRLHSVVDNVALLATPIKGNCT